MTWQARVGRVVRYRPAAGTKVMHATITKVNSQTNLDLRVGGKTKGTAFLGVLRADTGRVANTWYRTRRYPRPACITMRASWGVPVAG